MINEQLNYLKRLQRFEKIKPGLQTMRSLMAALDNPHTKFKSVHITGTNGKGSTSALLASILQQSNYCTGLYTSPHLCSFHERIVINGRSVSNSALSHLISQVRDAADQSNISATYFEFTTALAFLHFAQQSVDIAVIEVGMGGDLDATNVITPLLSIITNVAIDHTAWLGSTKRAIAKHKAGIIKPHVPLVTAEIDPMTSSYFYRLCAKQSSPFYPVATLLAATPKHHSLDGQSFTTAGLINGNWQISLLGHHQITNASTALTGAVILKNSLPAINPQTIHRGLAKTVWPGRLDIISRDPFILLDGAHNDAGFASLTSALDTCPFPPADTLVIGCKSDTDPGPILKHIAPRFRQIVFTQANYDPLPAPRLRSLFDPQKYSLHTIPNPRAAIAFATKTLNPCSLLLVTGSLYLIGDILSALKKPPCSRGG